MSRTEETTIPSTPEELERITAEYRRGSHALKRPPITIYPDPHVACPWPGCGLEIRALAFNGWEQAWDEATRERLLAAFWLGSGLLAKCPQCGRYVLFGLQQKCTVTEPADDLGALLPEDWLSVGHVGPKPKTGQDVG